MERKHVFCVNGDPVFLEVIRELFQEENYNVTTTNYVPRTFAQIAALQPDILIIDLVVGRQAGFDLLEYLAAESITQEIPVVAVSTTPELLERARQDAERYGADKYVAKPFDIEELIKTVANLLDDD